MNESRLFYDRDTAPLKHFKFLRIMFILSVVFSLVSAVYAGTEGAGSARVIINYVQAALSLFICIGLFSYMFYGVVLLFVHLALQIGLYAWEIHTDGALMGMSRGEAIAGIVGIAVYMILNLIYFRRRRPLFKPYNGEIPKAVHYAQPGGVPVQTNANWTQANSGPAESFGYERVQAPVNFVGMSAGAGPATSSAHSEKLKQAYSHFNSGGVARLFPGGIAQADTVVVSLAGLFGIDLAASRYEDYFSLLKAYADIAISREIKGESMDRTVSSVTDGNFAVLRSIGDTQTACAFFELNRENPAFTVSDAASYNQVIAKRLNMFGTGVADIRTQTTAFSNPNVTAATAPAPVIPQQIGPRSVRPVSGQQNMQTANAQTAVQQTASQNAVQDDQQDRSVQQRANRFCANCGAPLEEGVLFCGNCGTRVPLK